MVYCACYKFVFGKWTMNFQDHLNGFSKMRDETRSSSSGNKSHSSRSCGNRPISHAATSRASHGGNIDQKYHDFLNGVKETNKEPTQQRRRARYATGGHVNDHKQAKKLEKMGRNGDTQLVHVNRQEERMLKNAGGRGSVNPKTGLREYARCVGCGINGGHTANCVYNNLPPITGNRAMQMEIGKYIGPQTNQKYNPQNQQADYLGRKNLHVPRELEKKFKSLPKNQQIQEIKYLINPLRPNGGKTQLSVNKYLDRQSWAMGNKNIDKNQEKKWENPVINQIVSKKGLSMYPYEENFYIPNVKLPN